jgi:hypothetical protein
MMGKRGHEGSGAGTADPLILPEATKQGIASQKTASVQLLATNVQQSPASQQAPELLQ